MTGRDLPDTVWSKSSHSSGGSTAQCVEVAAVWRKSSRSSSGTEGACVEVAVVDGLMIAARDSKNPDGPVLGFAPREWLSFVARIKRGAL